MKTPYGLPARLFAYLAAVLGAGGSIVVFSLLQDALRPPRWSELVALCAFFALALAADLRPVPWDANRNDEVSVANIFIVTVAVLFGARFAVPMAALSIGVAQVVNRRTVWYRTAFNVSMCALAAAAAGTPRLLFHVGGGAGPRLAGLVLLGGGMHLLVNVGVISGVLAISERKPLADVLVPGLRNGGASFTITVLFAALAAELWRLDPVLLVLLAGPLFTITLYQRTALKSRLAARDAHTDSLTKLGNHRAYQTALGEYVATSERDDQPFALCLVDIDDFKSLNDGYGHPAGDQVLVGLAALLGELEPAQAFRLGGDEFAVLVGLDDVGAYRLLETIQAKLAASDLGTAQPATISAGIAAYPAHARDVEELQKLADAALYWAKAHGKNRSCLYSPTVVRVYNHDEHQRAADRAALLQAAKNLVRFVDAKDRSTANHSQVVSELAGAIAVKLGLDEATVEQLRLAGLLHDLGKIGIPDDILKAPRSLSADEYTIIKKHPEIGYSLLDGLELAPVDDWLLHHHEHWNGSGYPHGLAGEAIPLGSRIVLVADAFEAMTAERPYGRAQTREEALAELRAMTWVQFDGTVVAALERALAGDSLPAGEPVELLEATG